MVSAARPAMTSAGDARILNVDDNEDHRRLVTYVLEQAGFEVEEAGTGADALRLARAGASLVLLDIKLPDIDGREVCRRLKSDPQTSSLPVLHLTAAYRDTLHWASALEAGADGYLVNPVDPLVLVATVRALLRARSAEERLRREVEEHRRVVEALKESEERWHSLVAHAPDFVMSIDRDHRIQFINRTVPGITPEQVVGTSAYDYVPRESAPVVRENIERTLATGEPTHYEAQAVGPGGTTSWYAVRVGPIRRDGAVVAATLIVTDITGRKQAEEAVRTLNHELEERIAARTRELAESEERHRSVVSALQEGIVVQDAEGGIVACNKSAERILGRHAKVIMGRTSLGPDWVTLHPDGRQMEASEHPAALALATGRASTNTLMAIPRPDRTLSWILMGCQPLIHPGEARPRGVVSSFTDVTDKRRVRQRVDAQHAVTRILSEARDFEEAAPRLLRAIGEALGMDWGEVWVPAQRSRSERDVGGALIRADTWRGGGLTLLTPETGPEVTLEMGQGLPGRVWASGRAEWAPDVAADPTFVRREWAARAGLHGGFAFPVRTSRETQAVLAFFCRVALAPDADLLVTLEALGMQAGDFIERKRAEDALRKSEDRYRALFENSRDAIFMMDGKGRPVDVNQAALDLFGFRREEVCGIDSGALFVSEDERRWFTTQIRAAGSVRDFPARLRKKDGTEMDCLITAAARRDAEGRVTASEGIIRDVTAQKAAEWANRELSRHLLQVQDEERRRIARELHDSTAQELAAIGMQLAVLDEGASRLAARPAKALAESRLLAEQCLKQVRTLSYLLHPPLLDEAGLSAALRWLAEGFAARSGIEVAVELPPEVGRLGRDRELALFRIVQEALTNLHRHSGSPTATIRVLRPPGRLVLEVTDRGRGMAERLGGDASTLDIRHLGVGILGMRERLHQLGGRLEIQSSGTGTTVRAVLDLGAETEGQG